jgi:hypothetical protein
MTVIINGTTGISGVDGSAGTPAVQGSDTNTGVFYPAADTVGVSTGGSERMRVDSSGNVGIGTTSPSYKLSVNGSLSYSDARGANSYLYNSAGNYCGLGFYSDISLATRYAVLETQIGTSTTLKTDTATPLIFGTNATERMRIDSSGNVGIGTSSPSYKLQVNGVPFIQNSTNGTNNVSLYIGTQFSNLNETGLISWGDYSTGGTINYVQVGMLVDAGAAGSFIVRTKSGSGAANPTERMRIDSSGSFSAVIPSGSTLYPGYWCRAWVNFNGTGTVAIRASGNVTSITDNGTGDYTVNFTTAMPDTNYSPVGVGTNATGDGTSMVNSSTAPTTSAWRTNCKVFGSTQFDPTYAYIAVFR